MNNNPLVSVITPFFNAEKYFVEAIESVIAQTYDRWELMLIDDGSSDGSTAIAQRYAAQYPGKIHYLEHENHQNRGKSTARNLGMQQSKGDYFALLDADDVFLPEKLAQQVRILEDNPTAGMVYGPTLYWYSWTGNLRDQKRDYRPGLGVQPRQVFQPPFLMTRFLQDGGIVPSTCGWLIRRTIVERVGAFEESIQHMYEDQVFLAKICLQSPVYVDDGCWDQYRQHPESSSYVAIRQGEYHPWMPSPVRQVFLTWLGDYLTTQKIKDLDLWKAYQKELWPYQHPRLSRWISPLKYGVKKIIGVIKRLLTLGRS